MVQIEIESKYSHCTTERKKKKKHNFNQSARGFSLGYFVKHFTGLTGFTRLLKGLINFRNQLNLSQYMQLGFSVKSIDRATYFNVLLIAQMSDFSVNLCVSGTRSQYLDCIIMQIYYKYQQNEQRFSKVDVLNKTGQKMINIIVQRTFLVSSRPQSE